MKPQIILTADVDGTVTVETANIKGKACEALSKPLEDALGLVDKNVRKPEYHQHAAASQAAAAQQGAG